MPKRVWAVVLITLVNTFGYTMLVPVFPYIVDSFNGTVFTLGFLVAAYPLFQFFAAPILGSLSDRFGRRPILLVSFGGTFIAWVIFILSFYVHDSRILMFSLPLFLMGVSRAIDGVTGGNSPVTVAYIADSVVNKKRTNAFGLLGAAIGIGFIIGPLFGSYLSTTSLGYISIGLFALLLSLCVFIFILFFLPESLPKTLRKQSVRINYYHELNIFKKLYNLRTHSGLKKLFFIRICFAIAFAAYTSMIVVLLKNRFGVPADMLGMLFLVMGVAYLINQTVFLRMATAKFGELKVFYFGQVFMILSCLLIPVVHSIMTTVIVVLIANLGLSFAFPTFKTLISNQAGEDKQGEVNGLDESVVALSNAIGPLLAGLFYTYIAHVAYVLFALLVAFPHIVIWIKTKRVMIHLSTTHSPLDTSDESTV